MHLAGSGGELTLRERAAWGAFAGLMSGVFTGAVRALGGVVWTRCPCRVGVVLAVCGDGGNDAGRGCWGSVVRATGHGVRRDHAGVLGCWLACSLTLVPLVHGQVPTWSADAATRAYRNSWMISFRVAWPACWWPS